MKTKIRWDRRPLLSLEHLAWVLGVRRLTLATLSKASEQHYRPYELRKPGRSTPRRIDNPSPEMKAIQRSIKRNLLDAIELPAFVTGGVPGRSTTDNAALHVAQEQVVTLDVRGFFPSILSRAIADMWAERFRASRTVIKVLTRLTTFEGHLPQGAPTSTALANLVLLPTLLRLHDACALKSLVFSIYVDDITVSGSDARLMIDPIAVELSRLGLRIARLKTLVQPATLSQRVTGLCVNRKVSVPSDMVCAARQRLQRARRVDATATDLAGAQGLIGYLAHVSPARGQWLRKQLSILRRDHSACQRSTRGVAPG